MQRAVRDRTELQKHCFGDSKELAGGVVHHAYCKRGYVSMSTVAKRTAQKARDCPGLK